MTDQFDRLSALLRPLPLSANLFPPSSRYFGLPATVLTLPDGRQAIYLRRRFIPQPERFSLLQMHTVQSGERPDHLAAEYLGDPEQFWRIVDANRLLRPEELTEEPGRQVRITLPEGIQGLENA
jgi:hypothetical protein